MHSSSSLHSDNDNVPEQREQAVDGEVLVAAHLEEHAERWQQDRADQARTVSPRDGHRLTAGHECSGMSSELELAAARVNLCLGAERQLLARNAQQRRLPVTIVTGFLGVGKTSLLRHVLQHKLNLRVACAVSDLAAVNVDVLLLARGSNKLFQLRGDPNASLAAFRDAVWQVLNDDDDDALGRVDYLVMETSGASDPTQLVAAVQEKFGRMTRARLDSVVTVVDGDAVAQDAANGVPPCAVAVRQLQCADVVLLNKVDLVDDQGLRAAREVVHKYAPSARVYETDHGQVYLPHVLDVAPPEDVFNGGVSHEKVQAQWNTGLSALSGAVTPASSRLRVERGAQVAKGEAASAQAFASVAYERAAPTPLAAVHDWIQHHLPKGTLRAKGVMHIAELPKYRFVVQLSGKRRLEVENTGVWQSTPKTQFVVIGFNSSNSSISTGEHFDEVQAFSSLETCLSRSTDDLEGEHESARVANLEKLHADERFEILMSSEQSTTVAFRLTCPTSTLDETMLRHHHHVDMNELTKRLVREVNTSGGGSFLLYASNLSPDNVEGDQIYAVASIVGPASVLSMWSELDSRAESIITELAHADDVHGVDDPRDVANTNPHNLHHTSRQQQYLSTCIPYPKSVSSALMARSLLQPVCRKTPSGGRSTAQTKRAVLSQSKSEAPDDERRSSPSNQVSALSTAWPIVLCTRVLVASDLDRENCNWRKISSLTRIRPLPLM
ncbi:unnamed protein product [Phytophthora fragariaefolia]|uniref:Unnamed protein product n=1 Tax=Phytophthora fragariaefolia TaxID=1490495 RepID=A0A9W7CKD7_9STRA|nr:unnamed protein product [Phytophthora fragariaefolia]